MSTAVLLPGSADMEMLDFDLDIQEIPDSNGFDPAEMCSDSGAYSLCCTATMTPTSAMGVMAMCIPCCA